MDNKLATILYQVLDAIDRGEIHLQDCLNQHTGDRDELEDLLWEVSTLKNVSLPAPDPDFRAAARGRIIKNLHR